MNCVKIWSFELLIFKDMTLVEHMQMNSCQFTPVLSDWMPYHTILIPWFWTSVDSMLAMCAHPLGIHIHSMPKSIIFVHINITGR